LITSKNETTMKYTLLFLLFSLCFLNLAAQDGKGQRVESLKIAYLSGELNLDPATAEKFWPVYHQYEDELQAIIREKRRDNQDGRSVEEMLEQEQKVLDLKKKYSAMFARILNPEQVNRLYKAEKEFRQMLIRRSQRNEAKMNRGTERPVPARGERMQNPNMRGNGVRPERTAPAPEQAPSRRPLRQS
jgi:Skp family chaperone for outer membrane proteins